MPGYPCCCTTQETHSYRSVDYCDFNGRYRVSQMDYEVGGDFYAHLNIWIGSPGVAGSLVMGQHVEPLLIGPTQTEYICHLAYYEQDPDVLDGDSRLRQYVRSLQYGTNIELIWEAEPAFTTYVNDLDVEVTVPLTTCWKQLNGMFCVTGLISDTPEYTQVEIRDFATGDILNKGSVGVTKLHSILPVSTNLISVLHEITEQGGPDPFPPVAYVHVLCQYDSQSGVFLPVANLAENCGTSLTADWQTSLTVNAGELYYANAVELSASFGLWYNTNVGPIGRELMDCPMWGYTSFHCNKLYAVERMWAHDIHDLCKRPHIDGQGAIVWRDADPPTECAATQDYIAHGYDDPDDYAGYIFKIGEKTIRSAEWGEHPESWAYVVRDAWDENGDDTSEECLADCGDPEGDATLPDGCDECDCPTDKPPLTVCVTGDGCLRIQLDCPTMCDDTIHMAVYQIQGDCANSTGETELTCDPTATCGANAFECCGASFPGHFKVVLWDDCHCYFTWCFEITVESLVVPPDPSETEDCPVGPNCSCCYDPEPTTCDVTISGVGWATGDHCWPCDEVAGSYEVSVTSDATCSWGNGAGGDDFYLSDHSCSTPPPDLTSWLTVFAGYQIFDCGIATVNFISTIQLAARVLYTGTAVSTATYTKTGTMPTGVVNCQSYVSGTHTLQSQSGTCDWPATVEVQWT